MTTASEDQAAASEGISTETWLLAGAWDLIRVARDGSLPVNQARWNELADVWLANYTSWNTTATEHPPPRPPLPEGEYACIQLPGYVEHVGWLTDGMRAGQAVIIVRDRHGQKIAEVSPNAYRQIIPLILPLERPGPVAALTAGEPPDDDNTDYAEAIEGPGFYEAAPEGYREQERPF